MANKRHTTPAVPQSTVNGHRPEAVSGVDADEERQQTPLDPQKLVNLLLEYPRIQRAVRREEGTDTTRHGFYDVLLAEVALLAQWEENDIIALIREGNIRSTRPQPNIAYCKLVIQEARLKTQTGNLDFAREALLMNLSDTWKLNIQAVIRHGTENSLWHLRLEDGNEIQLGTSQDLMSQAKVRSKIFDVTGHMIPRYAPKDAHLWDHHLSLLALAAVTIDTPEMTRLGQIRAFIAGYLETQNCDPTQETSSEDWEHLAMRHSPFIKDGLLYLSVKSFLPYIRIIWNPKMIQSELLDLLRLLKGTRTTVAIHNPQATSRSVWRIPPAALTNTSDEENGLIGLTPFNSGATVSD